MEILKASAGSGKTFQLAKTYIRLLLESKENSPHRQILAVTFTNKATDEMKSRILKELDTLARTPAKSDYIGDFVKEFGSKAVVSKRAAGLLRSILHDYGSFNVSTIDRFFQQTLKAFAREVGQFSSYQVELDKNSLVRESVDRILESITEDTPELISWLKESVMERLQESGKFSLENTLYDTAIGLKSEEHRQAAGDMDLKKVYDKKNLSVIRKACLKSKKNFEDKARQTANACLQILDANGISTERSCRGFLKPLEVYRKNDGFYIPTEAFMNRASNPDLWFKKADKNLQTLLQPTLQPALDKFVDHFGGKEFKLYQTIPSILKQIYSLGIAGELEKEFQSLLKEKNVLSIDDSNVLLSRIIDSSDAPFVYEKIGVRIRHFLLDEFQDTSTIQWQNFYPLVKESASNGWDNLIVGDVKQSIYRWRGSDWHLLDEIVPKQLKTDPKSMQDNWRSAQGIVDFNNAFFTWAASRLDAGVSDVYADVQQIRRNKKYPDGSVQVTFCEGENAEMKMVLRSIWNIKEKGKAKYSQMAVLTRNNEEASKIASYLISEKIPVISDEALHAKSSLTVRRIVSLLSVVNDPSDRLGGFLASMLDVQAPSSWNSLCSLCEDLCMKLIEKDPGSFSRDVLYVQSFMDAVCEWSSMHGNNLSSFLKDWKGMDPKISSPVGCNAVRIMTIHKAKGLEFPYVIFPFAEKVGLFRHDKRWVSPDFKGTSLESVAEGVYQETLSSQSCNRLYGKEYEDELLLQHIDNINVFYVGLTRPVDGLHVICALPEADFRTKADSESFTLQSDCKFKDFSQMLYLWTKKAGMLKPDPILDDKGEPLSNNQNFFMGKIGDYTKIDSEEKPPQIRESAFGSYPVKGRLRINQETLEFFTRETPSPRVKGILMHRMLSSVVKPSDLEKAVEDAVLRGDIQQDQKDVCLGELREKIASVRERGWFPEDGSGVMNEVSLLDSNGEILRPDRVIDMPEAGKTVVVDYKFGKKLKDYEKQVGRYADIYRRMGREDVSGYLWYVNTGEIVSVV